MIWILYARNHWKRNNLTQLCLVMYGLYKESIKYEEAYGTNISQKFLMFILADNKLSRVQKWQLH